MEYFVSVMGKWNICFLSFSYGNSIRVTSLRLAISVNI